MKRVNIREVLANPEARQRLLDGAARAIINVGRDDTRPVEEEPMATEQTEQDELKNPYRALADHLRALPEDRRMLLSQQLRGTVGEVPCGCAFGVTFPRAGGLDNADVQEVYQTGEHGGDDYDGPLSQEEIEQHEVSRAFYLWVFEMGGDYVFVGDVMSTNDEYHPDDNSEPVARARYQHVLDWLDPRAENLDIIAAARPRD